MICVFIYRSPCMFGTGDAENILPLELVGFGFAQVRSRLTQPQIETPGADEMAGSSPRNSSQNSM